MNKIWLVMQREFLSRVQKKSFLIATILLPLIFPAIMAVLVYVAQEQKKNATKESIYYIDESGYFQPDTSKYIFKPFMCFNRFTSIVLRYFIMFYVNNPFLKVKKNRYRCIIKII